MLVAKTNEFQESARKFICSNELWDFLFESMEKHNFFLRHFSENLLEASRPPIRKWEWRAPKMFKITPPPFDIKREGTDVTIVSFGKITVVGGDYGVFANGRYQLTQKMKKLYNILKEKK